MIVAGQVLEPQFIGVEEQPFNFSGLETFLLVERIACNRVAERKEVYSNLVRPAGVDLHPQ